MSDPKNPGRTPGAEADATMIRPASDFREGDAGGTRADRVREWVKRNNPGRLPGAPQPDVAAGGGAYGGQAPVGVESARRAVTPDSASSASSATATGQQVFRTGGTESDPESTVVKTRESQGSGAGDSGFVNRMKAHAKTVQVGMSGAAAGAMGNKQQTGAAAEAVPAPDTGEDTQSHRRAGVARRTRKARLRLSQVDPWSVMKTAFLFSVAAGIVLWVATGTVWAVISSSGMFEEINRMVGDIIQTPGDDTPFRIQDYINTSKVMGTAALIAVIDVVIFTALATLGAFLYNLASAMIGGLEVTLAED